MAFADLAEDVPATVHLDNLQALVACNNVLEAHRLVKALTKAYESPFTILSEGAGLEGFTSLVVYTLSLGKVHSKLLGECQETPMIHDVVTIVLCHSSIPSQGIGLKLIF